MDRALNLIETIEKGNGVFINELFRYAEKKGVDALVYIPLIVTRFIMASETGKNLFHAYLRTDLSDVPDDGLDRQITEGLTDLICSRASKGGSDSGDVQDALRLRELLININPKYEVDNLFYHIYIDRFLVSLLFNNNTRQRLSNGPLADLDEIFSPISDEDLIDFICFLSDYAFLTVDLSLLYMFLIFNAPLGELTFFKNFSAALSGYLSDTETVPRSVVGPTLLSGIVQRSRALHDRKDAGAFYTDPLPSLFIAFRGFDFFLREKTRKIFGASFGLVGLSDLFAHYRIHPEDGLFAGSSKEHPLILLYNAVSTMRICDNSAGSGEFLLDSILFVLTLLSGIMDAMGDAVDAGNKDGLPPLDEVLFRVFENNIYGVDIDPIAVIISRARLMIRFFLLKDIVKLRSGNVPIFDPGHSRNREYGKAGDMDFNSLLKGIPGINVFLGNSLVGYPLLGNVSLPSSSGASDSQKLQLNDSTKKTKTIEKLGISGGKIAFSFMNVGDNTRLMPFHWINSLDSSGSGGARPISAGVSDAGNDVLKFDLIVGNPPYINNKMIPADEKRVYKQMGYVSAYKLYDISVLFVERSITLLKEGGVLSYILPNKFTAADYGIKIRELILNTCRIHEIFNISLTEPFKKIATYPLIMVLQKMPADRSFDGHIHIFRNISIHEVHDDIRAIFLKLYRVRSLSVLQSDYRKIPNSIFDLTGIVSLFNEISSINYKTLDECVSRWVYRPLGFTDWKINLKNLEPRKKLLKNIDRNVDAVKMHIKAAPFIGCANIDEFRIAFKKPLRLFRKKFSDSFLKYDRRYKSGWDDFFKHHIFIREVGKRLCAARSPGLWAHLTGIYSIPFDSLVGECPPFYLLGLLNSQFMRSFYSSLFGAVHMASNYLNFHASYLKTLPIPEANHNLRGIVAELSKWLTVEEEFDYIIMIIASNLDNEYNRRAAEIRSFLSEFGSLLRGLMEGEILRCYFPGRFASIPRFINGVRLGPIIPANAAEIIEYESLNQKGRSLWVIKCDMARWEGLLADIVYFTEDITGMGKIIIDMLAEIVKKGPIHDLPSAMAIETAAAANYSAKASRNGSIPVPKDKTLDTTDNSSISDDVRIMRAFLKSIKFFRDSIKPDSFREYIDSIRNLVNNDEILKDIYRGFTYFL